MNITAAILAAGASTRLGRPKQLLNFRGHSLLRHVAEAASSSRANDVMVILGYAFEQMGGELTGLRSRIVENGGWQSGISSSIRTAILALPGSVDGLLIMLCDQPLVTAGHLNALIDAVPAEYLRPVASAYAGSLGVPAFFPRRMFAELLQLEGDAGAKSLLQKHGPEVIAVPWPAGEIDIDAEPDVSFIL